MDNKEIILDVRNLNTGFITGKKEIKVVKDVSFRVKRGECLAIIGESGCGKSLTMNSIMRFTPRNAKVTAELVQYNSLKNGEITEYRLDQIKKPYGAEMRSLRGPEISMVFQDPMSSLNPVYRVGDQVAEGLLEHNRGMTKKEARARVLEMFRKLGIPDPEERINCYPHEFSGGMRQRVVIAIAMICNPSLIICDEPTTAQDVTIQAQIMELLKSLQVKDGKSIILITHNMGLIAQMADEICVMYMGRIVEFGTLEQIFDHPSHPYTKALLRSVPVLGLADGQKLETISGSTPNPEDLTDGCDFADRCTECMECCKTGTVRMHDVGGGHTVRCRKFDGDPEVM